MTGERLVVGRIRGLHGLEGTVRVEVLSDEPSRFAPGDVVFVEDEGRPLTVAWRQADGPGLLVRFAELRSRAAVEPLRERYLEAVALPSETLPEGTYYWHELPGATVRTTAGEVLGEVADVFRAGGAEVLMVRGGPRGELYVPTVRGVVVEFAPREGRITVDAEALDLGAPRVPRPRGRRSSRAVAAMVDRLPARGIPRPARGQGPGVRGVARGGQPMTLRLDVVTLFPELYPGPLGLSIPGRALERGLATLEAHDLRRWGLGRHRSVDDYPYGGGAGMILRPEPIAAALDALRAAGSLAILLDPVGEPFRQARAGDLASRSHLIFVCPRYEGVDERVRGLVDLELSVGDVVVSGGDLPAMLVMDAVLRLLPGAIDAASPVEESFAAGLLEYPHYTRPPEFRGERVPDVLVSGDHGAVERWRHEAARARTRERRPDLLASAGKPDTAPAMAQPDEASGS